MRTRNLLRALCTALLVGAGTPIPAGAQAPAAAQGDAAARVVILLFSDFQCPYCARVEPLLEEVRAQFQEDVRIVFKHNPLPIHPEAPLAHEAAQEAARQGKFQEMHDLLFANQQKLQPDDLLAYGRQLGLDEVAFGQALSDRRHRPYVERDVAEARALGVSATPTMFVNGRRFVGVPQAAELLGAIRSILNGSTGTAEGPVPADAFDLTGAPARGPADAPITIVEFSDFQCGFCARATKTMAQVLASYPAIVRWVVKQYPLPSHKDAPLAHRAALAAHEQGKFWEMHDALFASQGAFDREALLKQASAIGLDLTRFVADLDGERLQSILQRDIAEGDGLGVDGTPTFFINGLRLVGAAPYGSFVAAIERALAAARSGTPAGLDEAMSTGPRDAPVTIRWFADITSGLHREALALLKQAVQTHDGRVRVELKLLPSTLRDNAQLLHEATVAGADQGLFWQMHDLLINRAHEKDQETLAGFAGRLGLNREKFLETISSGRAKQMVSRHAAEARELDVRGTPTFFVNETRIDGLVPFGELDVVIARELNAAK